MYAEAMGGREEKAVLKASHSGKKNTQFSVHQKVPLAIVALATHESYTRVAYVQYVCSGARVAHATSPPRRRQCRPNMIRQLWGLSLCVDDERHQSIDFKHRKWEFPITAKVRAANCCVCVRAHVQCPTFKISNHNHL